MDIFNENDESPGACSIWRFYDFGGRKGASWKTGGEITDSNELLAEMLNEMRRTMSDYADVFYEGNYEDYHDVAKWFEMQMSNTSVRLFNLGTDLFTAVVTSDQISYDAMNGLVSKGPFTSYTSTRPEHAEGDLTFYVCTASQFFAHCKKVFPAKPKPKPKPEVVKLIKRTSRSRG